VHEPVPPSCARVRVLVLDDDEDARYILGRVLTYAGAVVRTAASAREAVMALDDGRDDIDVIVTDYSMPGDTGLRLLAHARDRPRPVPMIALTGYAGMQVKELDGAPSHACWENPSIRGGCAGRSGTRSVGRDAWLDSRGPVRYMTSLSVARAPFPARHVDARRRERSLMKTVLVVDDRPDARYTMVRVLGAAGFDVRETATGRGALRMARLHPDVIVLNVALQDIDRFEVVRRLKADSVTQAIPVVHKTAVYRDAEHQRRGLAAGADDYLVEPFEPDTLVATVRRVLSQPRS